MDKTEAEKALAVVDALRKRAVEIVDNAPYHKYVSEPDWAVLSLDGEEATLRLCSAESSYDCATFEVEEVEFPAYLLFLPEKEFHYWKTEEERIYNERQIAQRAVAVKQKEDDERATYEALKRKFAPQ